MAQSLAELTIDARDMEPPEPFAAAQQALLTLARGQTLRMLLPREPFPLYRALEPAGFQYATTRNPQGWFEVRIWHR